MRINIGSAGGRRHKAATKGPINQSRTRLSDSPVKALDAVGRSVAAAGRFYGFVDGRPNKLPMYGRGGLLLKSYHARRTHGRFISRKKLAYKVNRLTSR